ncbi:MAG: hypothetical protein R3290_12115 [Acidimicrobiia bacterium]|nr:hypothetical protein [Acidimicrobiia bacterium]
MNPHTAFVLALLLAPVVAIAGTSAGGDLGPASVAVAGALVGVAAVASFRQSRAGSSSPTSLRMAAVTGTVAVVAVLVVAGALVALVR